MPLGQPVDLGMPRVGELPASIPTLGDVLYGGKVKAVPQEAEWVALVRAIARGDQAALHALYDRAHRPVYTLIVRTTGSRESAEELTVDVFHDVWRRAASYHPENGTVLGWIMNQARSRANDRLRHDTRKKRVDPGTTDPLAPAGSAPSDAALELAQQRSALQAALAVLSPGEREAIEAAFFLGLTHAEVAQRLNEPLGTVKTRIRSALHKLRQGLAAGGAKP